MTNRISAVALLFAFATASCVVKESPPPAAPAQQPSPAAMQQPATDPNAVAAAPGQGNLQPWSGKINCDATEDLYISNALIEVAGNGPSLRGSCDIVIENSRIIAGGVGVVLLGSGDITIRNSHIQGGNGAVSLMGSGDVKLEQSRAVGAVQVMGSGDIHAIASSLSKPHIMGTGSLQDGGNNQWQ